MMTTLKKGYIFILKWLVLKPLVRLSWMVNGKILSPVRWYERKWDGHIRWRWLSDYTYWLTKYITFR